MSEQSNYPHGVPGWVTCLADDVPAAMAFYGGVFGWAFDHSEEEGYAVALLRGREVAGIGTTAAAGPDVKPAWITEVRVESAAATAAKALEAGGTVVAGPMDLSPAYKLVVLTDPTGAVICAYEPEGRQGAELVNEPSAWSMSTLSTPDPDTAARFYNALFGWESDSFGPMTMLRRPGYVGGTEQQPVPRDVVAMIAPPSEGPARWDVGFWIADADLAAATARRLGGAVVSEPADAPPGVPFRQATLADPGGATFTVSQLMLQP